MKKGMIDMKINEIEKNEWKEVFDLYFEEKERFGDSVTIEDVLESMRRCESCDKLVLTSEDELPTITSWKGEVLHCCDECYKDELENQWVLLPEVDEPDEYQEYVDRKLASEWESQNENLAL